MERKACTNPGCKVELRSQEFYKSKGRTSSRCKRCVQSDRKSPEYKATQRTWQKKRRIELAILPFSPPEWKKCSVCKRTLAGIEFYRDKGRARDGLQGRCKECCLNRQRSPAEKAAQAQRQKTERWQRAARSCVLRRKYGLTTKEYDALLVSQGGVCAICGSSDPRRKQSKWLPVDHDHATGKVRGLLCHVCNRGLGVFHDSVEKLTKAIRYLERTR